MAKTIFQSLAWFKRYKTLKSVPVGSVGSVWSLKLRKFSYSAKTRSAFGLARNKIYIVHNLVHNLIFNCIMQTEKQMDISNQTLARQSPIKRILVYSFMYNIQPGYLQPIGKVATYKIGEQVSAEFERQKAYCHH